MTEHQRLFLVQARTDFEVFRFFRKERWPECHAHHYLQMATEKLGKAQAVKHRPPETLGHRAFVDFLKSLSANKQAKKQLDYEGRTASWRTVIRKSIPLAESIEAFAPSIALDRPNPEYPWPRADPCTAPAEHSFEVWRDLQKPAGRQFLSLLADLFAAAESYL
jgi:hypothetical protein